MLTQEMRLMQVLREVYTLLPKDGSELQMVKIKDLFGKKRISPTVGTNSLAVLVMMNKVVRRVDENASPPKVYYRRVSIKGLISIASVLKQPDSISSLSFSDKTLLGLYLDLAVINYLGLILGSETASEQEFRQKFDSLVLPLVIDFMNLKKSNWDLANKLVQDALEPYLNRLDIALKSSG